MGNLLFSPKGRINSAQFMQGATLLIIASLVLSLLVAFAPSLMFINILGLVFIWCWVVLWRKRYHDAGKSGWTSLIPIVIWLLLLVIASFIIGAMFADPVAKEAAEAAAAAGDFGAALSAGSGLTSMGNIVNAVAGAAISYGVAMLFNNMIAHDNHDNQYGPESGTL